MSAHSSNTPWMSAHSDTDASRNGHAHAPQYTPQEIILYCKDTNIEDDEEEEEEVTLACPHLAEPSSSA